MPVLYQAKCSKCTYQSPFTHATDIAIRLDSSEIKILGYLSKTQTPNKLGQTLKQATREKRFVKVEYLICCNCGAMIEQYTTQPNQSCLLNLVVYVTLSLLCYFLLPFGPYLNLGIALVGYLVFSELFNRYQKNQYKNIQKLLPTISACPTCQQEYFEPLEALVGKESVCPQCKEKHLVYRQVGFL